MTFEESHAALLKEMEDTLNATEMPSGEELSGVSAGPEVATSPEEDIQSQKRAYENIRSKADAARESGSSPEDARLQEVFQKTQARSPLGAGDHMVAPPPPPKDAVTEPLGFPNGAPPVPKANAPAAPEQDTEMMDLQKQAKERREGAALGNAVTAFTDRPTNFLDYAQRLGGGGVSAPKPRDTSWDKYGAEGEQQIKDLTTRRASEAALEKQKKGKEAEAENKDPNSGKSQILREFIYRTSPDLKGTLDDKSYEDMAFLAGAPLVKMIDGMDDDKRKAALAQAKAAEVARKAGVDKNELDSWKKAMGPRYPEHAKELEAITTMKAANDYQQALEGDKSRAQSAINARTAAGVKADAKTTEDTAEQEIAGYKKDPKIKVSPVEASKARDRVSAAKSISQNMDELKALIKKHGTETWPTDAKAEMEALQSNILGELKGPAGFELGVLAGPDMAIMERALGDATKFSMGNLLGMSSQTLTKLEASQKLLNRKLSNYLSAKGYSLEGASAAPAAAAAPAAGAGTVLMHKKGFAPQQVPVGEEKEASDDGWSR